MEYKDLNDKVIRIQDYKRSYYEMKDEVIHELERVEEKLFTDKNYSPTNYGLFSFHILEIRTKISIT
jgi:hypothetical protein